MNIIKYPVNIVRRYPFTILFVTFFIVVVSFTYASVVSYQQSFRITAQRTDHYALDSFNLKNSVAHDSSKAATRLIRSMMLLKEKKDDVYEEAAFYYQGLYLFSHLLGLFSIIGSLIVMIVVTKGWQEISADLRLTLAGIFLVCSISYFVPKLMRNEKIYAACGVAYLSFDRQINYSVKVLSYHYCCTAFSNPDSVLNATADSNFTIINNNLALNYDVNFSEAAEYFDHLNSQDLFKK